MHVKILADFKDFQKWDELIESSPHGTVFHKSSWVNTISKLLNVNPKIYGCFNEEKLIGGCSFYIHKTNLFKKATTTVEMTPYGGIVLAQSPSSKLRKQEQLNKDIITSIFKSLNNEHFDLIQLINSPDFIDIRPFVWNNWESSILYAYYLKLHDDLEKTYSQNVRHELKRAQASNIFIKQKNDPALFYDLFSMTYKRQNLNPPATKQFFEKTIKLIESEDIGEMWVAETPEGEVISSEIILWDKVRSYRWAAASNPQFKKLGGVTYLLCNIFEHLGNQGFNEINLMAANTPHLAKFISSFNPDLISYYKVSKAKMKYSLFKMLLNFEKSLILKTNKKGSI